MDKQKSLSVHQKSLNELFNDKDKDALDPCPVCDADLYYGKDLTKRCGLVDEYDKIVGWLCPFCMSEFDDYDNVVEIFTNIAQKGKA